MHLGDDRVAAGFVGRHAVHEAGRLHGLAAASPHADRIRFLDDVSDDPELRAALMGYAEWGTRLAMHNSGDATDVVDGVEGWAAAGLPLDDGPADVRG